MKKSFKFTTGTSTLCIFDLACLQHRLDDDADWWSIPEEELLEVNRGNVAIFGLEDDGGFVAEVVDGERTPTGVAIDIRTPSGRLFVGAGEELTADGLEPAAVHGGGFVSVPGPSCRVSVSRQGWQLRVHLETLASSEVSNTFTSPVVLRNSDC